MAPIHDAAVLGGMGEVVRLVQEDPGVTTDTGDEDNCCSGETALQLASRNGHMAVACYLLDNGAEINFYDRLGWTALHEASDYGHLDMAKMLVSREADPTIISTDRWTPLMAAADSGHVAVARCLSRKRAVRATTTTIDVQKRGKQTALWVASSWEHLEIMKLLVEAGANPMMGDKKGQTPRVIAHFNGHHQCIELLEVRRGGQSRSINK